MRLLFKLVEGRHSTGRGVDWFKSGFGSDQLYLLGQQLNNILLKANGPGLVQHLYKAQMFSPFPFSLFPFPFLQTEIEIVSTMNAFSLFFF